MKTQKTLSLSLDVAQELDNEDNQSALVESLLRDYFDIEDE